MKADWTKVVRAYATLMESGVKFNCWKCEHEITDKDDKCQVVFPHDPKAPVFMLCGVCVHNQRIADECLLP